jgi:hypothetical protein
LCASKRLFMRYVVGNPLFLLRTVVPAGGGFARRTV